MIKTDLQLLEENRDQAQSMVLAQQAQIDLVQGKILVLIRPEQEKEREMREAILAKMKNELQGHKTMVDQFDKMIAEAQHADIR